MKLKYILSGLLIDRVSAGIKSIQLEELEMAESSILTDLDGFEKDDLDYPKEFLDELQKNGIDISGFSVAEAFEGNDERAIMNYNRLWHEKTDDGRIAVPYSFHKHFPKKFQFKKWLDNMSEDLGCVQLVYVPEEELLTTKYNYGILITNTDYTPDDDWCKSTFGIVPGYTSGNGPVSNFGVKWTWQLLLMATGCTVEGTAHHEMMHALGFKHEHVRPDRDDYLDLDLDYLQTYKASLYHNYLRLDYWLWQNSGHGFELRSVMNYNGRSYMKTNEGYYWTSNRLRLTSTDALQIQWLYCILDPEIGKTYKYTKKTSCQTADKLGLTQDVLQSRTCDGIRDCNGGEDEDGTFGECQKPKKSEKTSDGCCKYLTITDQDRRYSCVAKGELNDRQRWSCSRTESGHESYQLYYEPGLWSNSGAKRAGWVFGYSSCAPDYGSCDKGHNLVDTVCPPQGAYDLNMEYYPNILQSGFLTNVYCSRGEKFHTVKEFERKTKKNFKSLKDNVEQSDHGEKVKTRMMKVVSALVHISSKKVRACGRAKYGVVNEQSLVPLGISEGRESIQTSDADHILQISKICLQYESYLEFRFYSCKKDITRLNRLRKRCKAYGRHRLRFDQI